MIGQRSTRSTSVSAGSWRPVLISSSELWQTELRDMLLDRIPADDCLDVQPYSDALDRVTEHGGNVCFVDTSSDQGRGLELIRQLAQRSVSVVAVHSSDDSDLILRCLRSGANVFLHQPLQTGVLWEALDRLESRKSGDGRTSGRVVLAVPSKPNHGCTTVVLNLATQLRRVRTGKILVADLDEDFGSVSFLCKLKGPYSYLDAFRDCQRLDEELWKRLTVGYDGVDVLLAPDVPSRPNEVFEEDAVATISYLRRLYSLILLDVPNLSVPWRVELARAADQILLITTSELAAIHATRKTLVRLEAAGCPREKIRLVVNRYVPERGLSREAVEKALKLEVFQTLPNDYDAVQKAAFDGAAVAAASKFGKGVQELSSKLGLAPAVRPGQRSSGSWNLRLAFPFITKKKPNVVPV
jgi:pilus assembly protein CpaE